VEAPPTNCGPDTDDGHSPPSAGAAQHPVDSRVEIELGNGRLVRVSTDVDVVALWRILDALERR